VTPKDWIQLGRDVGTPVAVLLVGIWLLLTGRVHTDGEMIREHAVTLQERSEKEMYRELAFKSTNIAEHAAVVATRTSENTGARKELLGDKELLEEVRRRGLIR
jgi:hypothetical protein